MSCDNLKLASCSLSFLYFLIPAWSVEGMARAEAATLDQEVTLKMKAVHDEAG